MNDFLLDILSNTVSEHRATFIGIAAILVAHLSTSTCLEKPLNRFAGPGGCDHRWGNDRASGRARLASAPNRVVRINFDKWIADSRKIPWTGAGVAFTRVVCRVQESC